MPAGLVSEPEAVEAAPSFADVASSAFGDAQAAQSRLQSATEQRAANLGPRIEAAKAGQEEFANLIAQNPPPKAPTLPAAPSLGLRPFLATSENEPPEQAVAKLISLMGIFATGMTGAMKGDARAGLSALTGALAGWQAGDRERADRAFGDWQAKTKTLLDTWQTQRTEWEDWFKASKGSLDQRIQGLSLDMMKEGLEIDVARVESEGAKYLLEFLTKKEQEANELAVQLAKVQQARVGAVLKDLPDGVAGRLLADPEARKMIDAGMRPTEQMVARAIDAQEKALMDRQVTVAQQTGLAAAGIPARTPEGAAKMLQDTALSQAYVNEMARLVPEVRLGKIMGGIQPWVTQVIQSGKAGPIPVTGLGDLTNSERRLLALMNDYADRLQRERTGAAAPDVEFRRMNMGFLAADSVTPDVFKTRLQLQSDLLNARVAVTLSGLAQGGYRAPVISPPSLAPTGAETARPHETTADYTWDGKTLTPRAVR